MRTLGGSTAGRLRRAAARTVAATVAAMMALTAYAGPAHAQTRVVPDRGGSDDTLRQAPGSRTSDGEIRGLRVRWGRGELRVRVLTTRDTYLTDLYDLHVDTDRSRRGPERLARYDYADGRSAVHRVQRFAGPDSPPAASRVCRGVARDTGRGRRGREVLFTVPARCLGNPASLRVSVHSQAEELRGSADWAPAARRLSRPVRRN